MRVHWVRRLASGSCILAWIIVIACSTSTPAYAYVDPGSGLLLFQVLGSAFAGITFLLRKHIRHLIHHFAERNEESE